MIINGISIDDTFAEAFPMKATRIIVTAKNEKWAMVAANAFTGFASSVIACGCEASIEKILSPAHTPDNRHGIAILIFAMGGKGLAKQLETRTGQCILTSPTSAVFAGIDTGKPIPLGKNLRYFGDGFQISKIINDKRYWRLPVMEGEFLMQETTGQINAVGGGNFLVLAVTASQALTACEVAIKAMRNLPNIIMPFPGGVVRSGSKVGAKYPALAASTNDAFCPTLKGVTKTKLTADCESVLEIVIDGLSVEDIANAMRVGIQAVCDFGADNGILQISAGNYGGKLGPFHFHLRELMA